MPGRLPQCAHMRRTSPLTPQRAFGRIPRLQRFPCSLGALYGPLRRSGGGSIEAGPARGIGVDNVDVPAATQRGASSSMNTPEGNNITTAEHAIALIVSLARHIPRPPPR